MKLLFILYTTGRCNLRCRYCGGSFDPKIVPWKIRYDLRLLEEVFREGDSIAFYGGEPLLNIPFIEEVVERFDAEHYVIQTNGLLLDRLPGKVLERMDTILVSIDGGRELTDKNRGKGVYDRVLREVREIRSRGFDGDVVARMTVTEDSDIFRDVRHLLDLGLFDHVHWQLSMIWVERDCWSDLWGWIDRSYKPGLDKLFEEWLMEIERGMIPGIAPFQGVLKRILHEGPHPPCGAGIDSFAVLTDGRVVACPIAVREKWAEIGRLGEISRSDLEGRKPVIMEPCKSCKYLKICGTRCLYAHIERLWGEEGMRATCECTRHLIDLVQGNLDRIKEAAAKSGYDLEDLTYPDFNNTVEIIP
ncbi:MAG: TIGR04084 family radical SAM/SPASM domain-containing protein [Thaumarchaeota archaeon]|nr:TIGR04084 family radical SAM/SPASM domain-containing protein [Nitrososphaerota archaeon]